MLSGYRGVFRTPGSVAFCAASLVMRMPIAIYPIGIVLIISARSGHYGFAGVLSGCYTFGAAVGMPVLAVLTDRFGQRRLILPSTVVHVGAVVTTAVLVRTSAPDWLLVLPTVILGFTFLSVGSLVRARWAHALATGPELTTAMSLESVIDELIFVVGPLIATVLATRTLPVVVLYVAGSLVAIGALWLASLRATEPPVDPAGRGFALSAPGMLLLTAVAVPMGAVFASAEVSAVAFTGQHGHRGLSGVALACIAAASALAGLVYGSRGRRGDLVGQFRSQTLLFAVLPFVLLGAVNLPTLFVADFVLGLGIAPALIAAFGLASQLVPARSLTEGLTWITTGLSVGYGLGAALVGSIADQHGARTAFLVVIGSALLVGVLGQAVHAQLRGHESARAAQSAGVPEWEHR